MNDQALDFYNKLQAEVWNNALGLTEENYGHLRRYYTNLYKNQHLHLFYRYNWMQRVYPMQQIVSQLPVQDRPWRILDAGCGVGSEAFFWHSLNHNVQITGIDLNSARINTARVRHAIYNQQPETSLNIRFLEQDIFELLRQEKFDIVWTMEAISHIDPAEKFIHAVYHNLPSGGYLVISDSHRINPYMLWRIDKMRKKGAVERSYKTTETGKIISYANERLFSVGELSAMLKFVGFQIEQIQLITFFPPVFAKFQKLFLAIIKLDQIIGQVPFLRQMGGIYTIVAKK